MVERDQCHLTRRYRRAAPQSFNLNVEQCQLSFTHVLFHKLNQYDSHLLIKALKSNGPNFI